MIHDKNFSKHQKSFYRKQTITGVNIFNIYLFLVNKSVLLGVFWAGFNVSWRCILKRKTLDGSASLTVRDGRACYNAESRFYDFHRAQCIRAARRISDATKNWLKQLIRTGYVGRMQCLALREVFAYASRKELVRNLITRPSLKWALYTFISDKWQGNNL